MEGPPLGLGGEGITWPDQVAPRGRKASSPRKNKPQTSNLKPMKTSFTPASLGFCVASPTETEPSHCSVLQTLHSGAPIPSNGLNVRF